MLTPDGVSASKMDKIMLLSVWAKFLGKKSDTKPMIYAGMGKPTYPLHPYTAKYLATYWNEHAGEAINYGDPQGDLEAREVMSKAMTSWYKTEINEKDILFTVGGAGALHSIFAALKSYYSDTPNFRVITPFPYYTLYADNDLRLHPIQVMNETGYRLNAASIMNSISSANKLAKKDSGYPRMLLLCDPNNPLGSILGESELKKIAQVLRKNPKLNIILDEAYAEMVLDGTQHVSLLSVAPDLKKRIIIMRSATKGLSAAGERMAITIAFNKQIMNMILEHSIRNYGHAPRSLQMAYAKTMEHFSETQRMEINKYYRQKVEYVQSRLCKMNAMLPDSEYHIEATFYILGDFSELFGDHLSKDACLTLEKYGVIASDEDIAYSFLFNDSVMVAPASYYGIDKKKGYLRITCSADMDELQVLMDRMETRLRTARLKHLNYLKQAINEQLIQLETINHQQASEFSKSTLLLVSNIQEMAALKQKNSELKQILLTIKCLINQETVDGQIKSAKLIQSSYRAYRAKKNAAQMSKAKDDEWRGFVHRVSPQPSTVRTYLEQLNDAQRLELAPWKESLKEKDNSISARFLIDMANNPLLNTYSKLIMAVVITSGIIGICSLVSMNVAGLAVASVLGVSAGLMCLGLFSQSISKNVEKEPKLEACNESSQSL